MAWSTRQLADLTGVTLRTIRHWHDVGLMPEPERLTNGYKQYTATHLVLALRIERLTSLGFSLEQVRDMLDSETQGHASLRMLRVELDERIAALSRLRADVDELVERGVAPDLSPDALLAFDALGTGPGSRSLAILLARLLPDGSMPAFAEAMRHAPAELADLDAQLLRLPAHASEDEIASLADRGVSLLEPFLAERGDAVPSFDAHIGDRAASDAVTALLHEHMHAAQRAVMARIADRLG